MVREEEEEVRSGTVEVRLRFWRNRHPSGKGGHRGSGTYLPDGLVWPAGTVSVPRQPHASSTAERKVNHSFEWMGAIRDALEDAGIKMVPPDYK
jgi:hypothetical protein